MSRVPPCARGIASNSSVVELEPHLCAKTNRASRLNSFNAPEIERVTCAKHVWVATPAPHPNSTDVCALMLGPFVRAMRLQPFVVSDSLSGSISIAVPGSPLTQSILAAVMPGRNVVKEYDTWLNNQLSALAPRACR